MVSSTQSTFVSSWPLPASTLLLCNKPCSDYSCISFISSLSVAGVPALAGKLGLRTGGMPIGCLAPAPCAARGAATGSMTAGYAVKMSPVGGS